MQIEMIALQRQRYNGVWIKEGASFNVDTEAEADEMEGIRPPLARRNTAKKGSYEDRSMQQAGKQAEAAPQVAVTAPQPQKGKYDRRDMRAR